MACVWYSSAVQLRTALQAVASSSSWNSVAPLQKRQVLVLLSRKVPAWAEQSAGDGGCLASLMQRGALCLTLDGDASHAKTEDVVKVVVVNCNHNHLKLADRTHG